MLISEDGGLLAICPMPLAFLHPYSPYSAMATPQKSVISPVTLISFRTISRLSIGCSASLHAGSRGASTMWSPTTCARPCSEYQPSWRHRLEEWYGVHRDAVFGITNALVVCDGRCRERAWPQETGCVDASHDTSLHVVCALKTGSLSSSLARCSIEQSPQPHQRTHMPSSVLTFPTPSVSGPSTGLCISISTTVSTDVILQHQHRGT